MVLQLVEAMAKMLGDGGQKSVRKEMREILEGMTMRTWRQSKEGVLELLAAL